MFSKSRKISYLLKYRQSNDECKIIDFLRFFAVLIPHDHYQFFTKKKNKHQLYTHTHMVYVVYIENFRCPFSHEGSYSVLLHAKFQRLLLH